MRDYTYSIARIRSKEVELLGEQDIEQLINAHDYADALRVLRDKGYSNEGSVVDDAMRDLWVFLEEIADEYVLKVLRIPVDYHNIKASVKSVFSDIDGTDLLEDYGTVDKTAIYNAVKNGAYGELPQNIADTAENAMSLILKTQDSQLCDIEIDKAELNELWDTAEQSGDDFIKRYVSYKIRFANLKTALRCAVMGKSESFTENALCDKSEHDIHQLARVAENGKDALIGYLELNGEDEAAAVMKNSVVAFEKWCDDKIMSLMREVRYDCFGEAAIIAYAYAKTAEIKAVRLILSAKRNKLENIRERVRELYV